jgi:hypothetical protein
MPTEFTAQEYIYAATALRVSASITRQRAQDPAMGSSQGIFEGAAEVELALSVKFQKAANELSPPPVEPPKHADGVFRPDATHSRMQSKAITSVGISTMPRERIAAHEVGHHCDAN